MQRHELLQLMATLQLSGMRAAFDEIVADGLRRQHAFDQMLGALLRAEVAEKRARSEAGHVVSFERLLHYFRI